MLKYLIGLTLCGATLLLAAPAYQATRTFTQADGTPFKAKAQGDEYLNWVETEDGDILRYNTQTKNYEFAEIKDGNLKKSGRIYKKRAVQNGTKSASLKQNITRKDLKRIWLKNQEERHHRHHKHNH